MLSCNSTAQLNSASNNDSGKRKRGVLPKPLSPSKISKSRSQARVVAKQAQIFDTVDLVAASQNVNVLQNITIKTAENKPDVPNQVVAVEPSVAIDFLPSQAYVETIFNDAETDDAIDAFMAQLDSEHRRRTASPDLFEEDEDAYRNDTVTFMEEKIALIKTKIEILSADRQKLQDEQNSLLVKLDKVTIDLGTAEKSISKLEINLEKFNSFRNVL